MWHTLSKKILVASVIAFAAIFVGTPLTAAQPSFKKKAKKKKAVKPVSLPAAAAQVVIAKKKVKKKTVKKKKVVKKKKSLGGVPRLTEQEKRELAEWQHDINQGRIVIVPTVRQKEGAECGYHGLYNAWAQYERVERHPVPDLQKNIQHWKRVIEKHRQASAEKIRADIQEYDKQIAGLTGQNARAAKKRRDRLIGELKEREGNQWLDDGEIAFLEQDFVHLAPQHLTIIPDVVGLRTTPILIHENLALLVKELRENPAKTTHAFVLGDMRHNAEIGAPIGGIAGHWIAVVVQKVPGDGFTYYALDSIGWYRKNVIRSLQWLLETFDVRAHQERTVLHTAVVDLLERMKAAVGLNPDYRGTIDLNRALDLGEQVLNRIRPFTHFPHDHPWKQELRTYLHHIATMGDFAQRVEAQALLKQLG